MNFSFRVVGAAKAEVKAAIATKLIEVVAAMPDHAADATAAQTVADIYVDMLAADDTRDLAVVVNGTLLIDKTDPAAPKITSASITVGAGYVDR